MPASTFISVDLPAPFSPTRACTSPRLSSNCTLSRARTPGKVLLIPSILRIILSIDCSLSRADLFLSRNSPAVRDARTLRPDGFLFTQREFPDELCYEVVNLLVTTRQQTNRPIAAKHQPRGAKHRQDLLEVRSDFINRPVAARLRDHAGDFAIDVWIGGNAPHVIQPGLHVP